MEFKTVMSFGVLLHHGRVSVHAPWAAHSRRSLPGNDLTALVATMCVAARTRRRELAARSAK